MSDSPVLPLLVMIGAMLAMLLVGLLVILRCFRRCGPDEALIRSGAGGTRVLTEGGVLAYPGLHEVRAISLRPVRLAFAARGPDAVRTREHVKAEVTLEIEVRVERTADDILTAARAFGDGPIDSAAVRERIGIAALASLRRIAGDVGFVELWEKREDVADRLTAELRDRLRDLGLRADELVISGCAMVPIEQLDPQDILDAVAIRNILEMTTPHQLRANEIRLETELARLRAMKESS